MPATADNNFFEAEVCDPGMIRVVQAHVVDDCPPLHRLVARRA